MIAQIANGGFKIQPSFNLLDEFALGEKIIENQKHLEILQDSLNVATNEWKGTSYKSRIIGDLKFRDHSLFTGYGPVSNPEYAISVVIDHGGSGSSKAAPIAKKVMKKVFQLYYMSS